MKHPLRWYHSAIREITCWFLGHNWKSSWHRRTDAAERMAMDNRNALPYRERHGRNPYYEHSAAWHYRCRRCRTSTRDDAWHPWYRDLWSALHNGLWHAQCSLRFHVLDRWFHEHGHTYYVLPRRYWAVVGLLCVVEFCGNALVVLHFDRHWPVGWLMVLLLDAEYALQGWLDPRTTCLQWVAPRPEVPGEIGYYVDAKCYDPEHPMRMRIVEPSPEGAIVMQPEQNTYTAGTASAFRLSA